MRGGANRKSLRAKKLAGTIRRDRIRQRVVAFSPRKDRRLAEPPMWLRPMAAAKFAELAPLLIKRGILTKFTKDLLANVCMHWELVVRCYHRVSRDGPLVKNSRGMTVKHPALQIVRDHSKAIRDGLFRLGMTPIDMEKVGGVDANEDAEAAAFFGIR